MSLSEGGGVPASAPAAASASLWIGDVGPTWEEPYIASFFQHFAGFRGVKLMSRSGYGFADFDEPSQAVAALEAMQGQPIGAYGATFRLNCSGGGNRRGSADGAAGGDPSRAGAAAPPAEFSIFVGDLAYEATDDDLRAAFAPRFPALTSARVMTDPYSGHSKGYAFVRFSTQEDARRAVAEMNGYMVLGRALRVSEATPRGAGRGVQLRGGQRGGPPAPGGPAAPYGGGPQMMGAQYPMPAGGGGGGGGGGVAGPYGGLYGGGGGYGQAPPGRAPQPYGGPGPYGGQYMPHPSNGGAGPVAVPSLPRPTYAPPPTAEEGQTTLFVGGLDPSVPDAELWAAFAPYGPVSFVKSMRDRGCGFVQFQYAAHAEAALQSLPGFQLGAGRIRVQWGKVQLGQRRGLGGQAPPSQGAPPVYGGGYPGGGGGAYPSYAPPPSQVTGGGPGYPPYSGAPYPGGAPGYPGGYAYPGGYPAYPGAPPGAPGPGARVLGAPPGYPGVPSPAPPAAGAAPYGHGAYHPGAPYEAQRHDVMAMLQAQAQQQAAAAGGAAPPSGGFYADYASYSAMHAQAQGQAAFATQGGSAASGPIAPGATAGAAPAPAAPGSGGADADSLGLRLSGLSLAGAPGAAAAGNAGLEPSGPAGLWGPHGGAIAGEASTPAPSATPAAGQPPSTALPASASDPPAPSPAAAPIW